MRKAKVFSLWAIFFMASLILSPALASAAEGQWADFNSPCSDLPSHATLQNALKQAIATPNGGLDLNMWGTIVNRDGVVCAVAFTGDERGDQWPGSRVISAQKANTANAFSLNNLALSTANLFSAVQPGGSLFGLQESNPVNVAAAYGGYAGFYGLPYDPLVGQKIGGVNVFGGGLALYDAGGKVVGALGVSGDSSCADHVIAWKVRSYLELDYVPLGVSPTGDDNIIFDIWSNPLGGTGLSRGGFGHPVCFDEKAIAQDLPITHPISTVPAF